MANMHQQLNSIDMLLFAGKISTERRPDLVLFPLAFTQGPPNLCPHIKISYFLLYDLLEINLLKNLSTILSLQLSLLHKKSL